MRLFLLRHAEAVPGTPDAERVLTKKGQLQVKCLVESLSLKTLSDVRAIEHSGFVRAVQTASRFVELTGLDLPLVPVPGLRPVDNEKRILKDIRLTHHDRLIVGHNPNLALLAGRLLGGGRSEVSVVLKKCALIALERTEGPTKKHPLGKWCLLWLIDPSRLASRPE
jgi:phosphohistidine phosphatase